MSDSVVELLQAIQADQRQINLISHNIANQATPGYKSIVSNSQAFRTELSTATSASELVEQTLDMSQGQLVKTNNLAHVALSGNGFFVTQDYSSGKQYLTRSLALDIDPEGYLSSIEGDRVLVDDSPLRVKNTLPLVSKEGEVFVSGQSKGMLSVVELIDDKKIYIDRFGRIELEDDNVEPLQSVVTYQGFIENSNVNTTDQMIRLMQLSRHIESNQRAFRIIDELIGTGINDVGNQ
jgi:flagellar basal-body rod protein FlgF